MGPTLLGTLIAVSVSVVLAWKWELAHQKVVPAVVIFGAVSGIIVNVVARPTAFGVRAAMVAFLTIALGVAALLYMFRRDPERLPPDRDDVVVSPADGKVIYVRRAENGELPVSTKRGRPYPLTALTKTELTWGDAVVIGIAMNFLDVHVNRAPVAGRIALSRHCAGSFASLKRPESVFENERATTLIRGDASGVAMVQIASRLVRQIVNTVREGDHVQLGQRIGMIRFGSQVDVILPADAYTPHAKVGQRLTAGVSVIATLGSDPGTSQGRCA